MPTAVSAPGKVLLAGGYLVLDRQHTGLVFGLSARIHVLLTNHGTTENQIVVRSPQFTDATWIYKFFVLDGNRGVAVSQLNLGAPGTCPNKFVETTLIYALTYIIASNCKSAKTPSIEITILADADYYSHAPQPSQVYPRFPVFNVPLSGAHKTGLGSSAALVTALTAALLMHHNPTFDPNITKFRNQLHNLAQISHCAAQGRVGSGFDVAAAVHGTCIYRRFSPDLLTIMSDPGRTEFAIHVRKVVDDVESHWDVEIQKQSNLLPRNWALVMCDVDCGSSTVSMVKKVWDWRRDNVTISNIIWGDIQQLQAILVAQFKASDAQGVAQSLDRIRQQVRRMSDLSGVLIEPPEQTKLLNTVKRKVKGVIGGVVPGAGGYDAIALLVKDNAASMSDLKAFLENWSAQTGGKYRILGVRGDSDGVKMENYESYTAKRA